MKKRIIALAARWFRAMWEALRGSEGYLLLGKLVFNALALIAALLTVLSLIGTWASAERQEIQQESARLSEALYSEESGQRLEALRGYASLVRDFGDKREAVEKARFALIDYFARWRSGKLSARSEQKSLEFQAAWRVAALLQPEGWYGNYASVKDSNSFAWIETERPVAWMGSADPRTLFRDGSFEDTELADLNLSCLDLGAVNLTRASFTHITARGAKLGQAKLIDASINNVKMKALIAKRADFSLAKISLSDFSSIETKDVDCGGVENYSGISDFTQSYFQDSSLNGVSLVGVRLDVADFTNALLSEVDFSDAFGSDASFSNSTIYSTHFDKASLIRSDFSGAKIGRSSFKGATLTGSNLSGARFLDSASEESLLEARDLGRVNVSGTIFSNPEQVCRMLARGAVLVSDYQRWSNAGRPTQTWSFTNDMDRQTLRACSGKGHRR